MTHCIVFSNDLSQSHWASFDARGFNEEFDGIYEPDQSQEILGNNKPVYKKLEFTDFVNDKCMWYAGNNWWIGYCSSTGQTEGHAYLEPNTECPFLPCFNNFESYWKMYSNNKFIKDAFVCKY